MISNEKIIQKIQPLASFKAIGILLVGTAILWLVNLGLNFLADRNRLVATDVCLIAPEFTAGEATLTAQVNCSGSVHPLNTEIQELLWIVNLPQSKRLSMSLTCEIYDNDVAYCTLPIDQ